MKKVVIIKGNVISINVFSKVFSYSLVCFLSHSNYAGFCT